MSRLQMRTSGRADHGAPADSERVAIPGLAPAPRRALWIALAILLLLLGLAAGFAAGWKSVTSRHARAVTQATPEVRRLVTLERGPIDQLARAGELAIVDSAGSLTAISADGRRSRRLGAVPAIAGSVDLPTPFTQIRMRPGDDLAYGVLADKTPAAVNVRDGHARRLLPAGFVIDAPMQLAENGSLIGVCGVKGAGTPARKSLGVLVDRAGATVARLPGCALAVAHDGSAAVVTVPGKGCQTGEGEDSGPAAGLELWRRTGPARPVVTCAAITEALRAVSPSGKGDVLIVGAALSPDVTSVVVSAAVFAPSLEEPPGSMLLAVNLASGALRPTVVESPGAAEVAAAPTGGFAYRVANQFFGNTTANVLTLIDQDARPRLLWVGPSRRDDPRILFSPDGRWVLSLGPRWTFTRVDQPSVVVSYSAPGDFTGWASEDAGS